MLNDLRSKLYVVAVRVALPLDTAAARADYWQNAFAHTQRAVGSIAAAWTLVA